MSDAVSALARLVAFARSLAVAKDSVRAGWRNIALIGLGLGLLSVAITLLLEPFGTDQYRATLRTLRLSGYAICFIVPFLLLHAVDRAVYRLQSGRWWLANELVTRSVLIVFISTASWLYNITIINDIRPSFAYWADYMVSFSLPSLPILLPTALLMAYFLVTRFPEPEPELRDSLRVQGQGRGETLTFDLQAFLFAEAQQNYVAIHLAGAGGVSKPRLLRMTLTDLQQQIPGSVRVHRSFLVHPSRVMEIRGNAKKRRIVLDGVERTLPASQNLDTAAFEAARFEE